MVTAPYLAEQFEVSRRTINRDIEDLCKIGISIVTKQGINGGISIMGDKENLITWLLSFRDKVELLEPKEIRGEFKNSLERMHRKYEGNI